MFDRGPLARRLTLAGVWFEEDAEAYRRRRFFFDLATDATDAADQIGTRELAASLRTSDAHFDDAAWRRLVERFALAAHLDKPMYMLSTGSKRKAWLARGLASGRALILPDEPSGALDAASVRCLRSVLTSLSKRSGQAVIVASAERIERVALVQTIDLAPR